MNLNIRAAVLWPLERAYTCGDCGIGIRSRRGYAACCKRGVVSAAVIGVYNHTQVKYFSLFIGKLAVAPYCMEYGLRRGERFIVLVLSLIHL